MSHHSANHPAPQVKLYSLNIRGLNTPEKRSQLLLTLQKNKADVLFHETHFRYNNIPKLHSNFYPIAYHTANDESKSKGVSILISKNCPIQIQDTLQDVNGQYLFLKGKLYNKPITLANLYAPNKQQVPFFRNTLRLVSHWHAYCWGRF